MGWVKKWVNTVRFHWIREKQRIFRSLETQSHGKPAPFFIRSHSECACMCAKSLQSGSTLCDAMDCSPPDSSVHGILQARILKWVAMPSSRRSSQLRIWTQVSRFAGRFFTAEPPGQPRPHSSAPQKSGKRLSITDIVHSFWFSNVVWKYHYLGFWGVGFFFWFGVPLHPGSVSLSSPWSPQRLTGPRTLTLPSPPQPSGCQASGLRGADLLRDPLREHLPHTCHCRRSNSQTRQDKADSLPVWVWGGGRRGCALSQFHTQRQGELVSFTSWSRCFWLLSWAAFSEAPALTQSTGLLLHHLLKNSYTHTDPQSPQLSSILSNLSPGNRHSRSPHWC